MIFSDWPKANHKVKDVLAPIRRWFYKPAPWWLFWMPQSGIIGSVLFFIAFYFVFWVVWLWTGFAIK